MSAILMDGKALRDKKYLEFEKRIAQIKTHNVMPKLVVVLVGEDPASQIYVKHKQNACQKLGIVSEKIALPAGASIEELDHLIQKLNNDDSVHGILVQFPLPSHFAHYHVTYNIHPHKDVDGLNPTNQGINLTKESIPAPLPCTPNGVMEFFKEYKIDLAGMDAVIIGRSNIVGRPMAYLLTHANATVSTVHTRTKPETYKRLIRAADIVVSAAGVKDTISPDMVKPGVILIDVGIIRDPVTNKIRGDINYKNFLEVASYITPVPGGVGPMTVTMLINNLIFLVEKYWLPQ